METVETTKIFSFFKRISRLLFIISFGFFLTASLAFPYSSAYADNSGLGSTDNSGLGLNGSNPERKFYESKVLDESVQNGNAEDQRFYSRDRENDTLAGPGKMYPYSDVDPRQDTTSLNRKVDNLVNRSEQGVVDRTKNNKNLSRELSHKQSVEADDIRQKLEDVPQEVSNRAKSNLRQLRNKVGQQSENFRTNAEDFVESVPKVVKQGTRNLKDKVSDANLN